MALNLWRVDIRATMEEAAEGVQDRLKKDGITLTISAAPGIGSFTPTDSACARFCSTCCPMPSVSRRRAETVQAAAEQHYGVVFTVTD